MTESDLDSVVAIEQKSFPDPWPRRFFADEIAKPVRAFARVARKEGAVVGYLVAWFILDEVHLGNLAVHADYRRSGIARKLLRDLLGRASRRGARFVTLEVRAGNHGAISLYESSGFRRVAQRKGYYGGREDAIIMMREFPARRAREVPAP